MARANEQRATAATASMAATAAASKAQSTDKKTHGTKASLMAAPTTTRSNGMKAKKKDSYRDRDERDYQCWT